MDGLGSLEGNLVGAEVDYSDSVIFEAKLLDGVNGIAVELILAQTEFLKSTVDLQHLRIMNRALLPDTLVLGCIQVE